MFTDMESTSLRHLVVHQATGMVSVQLGSDVTEALRRLHSYAASNGCELVDVAQQVVDRRIRFDATGEH